MKIICLVLAWPWVVSGWALPAGSVGSGGSTVSAPEYGTTVATPPLPPAAGIVMDTTDGAYAGSSYLDVAYNLCVQRCTPDPFMIGVGIGFSLVYPQTRILYGAYVGGCIAGCYAAYLSR